MGLEALEGRTGRRALERAGHVERQRDGRMAYFSVSKKAHDTMKAFSGNALRIICLACSLHPAAEEVTEFMWSILFLFSFFPNH